MKIKHTIQTALALSALVAITGCGDKSTNEAETAPTTSSSTPPPAASNTPVTAKPGNDRHRESCVTNLKQIGIAFRIYMADHEDRLPWQALRVEGGSAESTKPNPTQPACTPPTANQSSMPTPGNTFLPCPMSWSAQRFFVALQMTREHRPTRFPPQNPRARPAKTSFLSTKTPSAIFSAQIAPWTKRDPMKFSPSAPITERDTTCYW